MAIETNYMKYTCDRCRKIAYLTTSNPQKNDWIEIRRVTADGGEQKRELCNSCQKQYFSLVTKGDEEFTDFMANKQTTTEGVE